MLMCIFCSYFSYYLLVTFNFDVCVVHKNYVVEANYAILLIFNGIETLRQSLRSVVIEKN